MHTQTFMHLEIVLVHCSIIMIFVSLKNRDKSCYFGANHHYATNSVNN